MTADHYFTFAERQIFHYVHKFHHVQTFGEYTYMATGIQICGLNGCGKSTVGKALAKELGFHFIDNEFLFFSRTDANEPYTNPRPRVEAERLLMNEVAEHSNFVFAAVKGDYGKEIIPLYNYVVLLEVPKEIRSQRVRNRSFLKFGNRMLAGGDLYEPEEAFFQMAASRHEDEVEKWVHTLHCPIIKADGTKSVEEIVAFILTQINI